MTEPGARHSESPDIGIDWLSFIRVSAELAGIPVPPSDVASLAANMRNHSALFGPILSRAIPNGQHDDNGFNARWA